MKRAAGLLLGLVFLTIAAQSAEARRFRIIPIPRFGGGETIDLVYNLPDEEPFVKEGQFFDIGYLNSPKGNSYVLYNGDRYHKLTDEDLTMFTGALGFDPTAQHRAKYAAGHAEEIAREKAARAHRDELIAQGRMIERRPGETSEAYAARRAEFRAEHSSASASDTAEPAPPSGSGFGGLGWKVSAILLLALLFFGRRLYAGIFALARAVSRDPGAESESSSASDGLTFDQRVAKRLSELNGETPQGQAGIQADHATGQPLPAGPAPRTFGRKAS